MDRGTSLFTVGSTTRDPRPLNFSYASYGGSRRKVSNENKMKKKEKEIRPKEHEIRSYETFVQFVSFFFLFFLYETFTKVSGQSFGSIIADY